MRTKSKTAPGSASPRANYPMTRREALLTGAALLAPALVRCRLARPDASRSIAVDDGFARLALKAKDRDDADLRSRLLSHPALHAMARHQRMAGSANAAPAAVLDRVLAEVRRTRPGPRVLEAWAGRYGDLGRHVVAAEALLPPGTRFGGTVFLVAGYDLGVAAPPDLLLNVAHPHFLADPRELGFYATHEAHHAGFLSLRPPPALRDLQDPARLREIVAYFTQLEGLGVHAAYALRKRQGALGADADYQVYTDPAAARRATARYAELRARIAGTQRLPDAEVGAVLEAMSSGERIWYRFGAQVAAAIERDQGRAALVDAIVHKARFQAAAESLLRDRRLRA